ncbi:nuclear receptor coactivator 2 [Caerostris extrusa]|uniref:Nuclear receptor coactivator 2 n=1 Tax=Caerostris extrusa TaxID=172846 RepID=A0AAV4XNQ6_CAEEX|nr:nuclear receptor coactivator 2 [Caerostris extrusa]
MGGLLGDGQNSASNATQKFATFSPTGLRRLIHLFLKTHLLITWKIWQEVPRTVFVNHNSGESMPSQNIILRELLNQEDDDMNDEGSKSLSCDSNCNVSMVSELCSYDNMQKGL